MILINRNQVTLTIRPKKTKGDPDSPEPSTEEDIQIAYSSDQFFSPSIVPVTNNYP
jgi:hypothetical protein